MYVLQWRFFPISPHFQHFDLCTVHGVKISNSKILDFQLQNYNLHNFSLENVFCFYFEILNFPPNWQSNRRVRSRTLSHDGSHFLLTKSVCAHCKNTGVNRGPHQVGVKFNTNWCYFNTKSVEILPSWYKV